MNATVITTCNGLSTLTLEPYNLDSYPRARLHAVDSGRHVGIDMDVDEAIAFRDGLNEFIALTKKESR